MKTLIILGILVVIVALILQIVRRGSQLKVLLDKGVPATARIIEKRKRTRQTGNMSKNTYWLVFEFKAGDGQNHKGFPSVTETEFNAANEGDEVEIVYLPDKPGVNATKEMIKQLRQASR